MALTRTLDTRLSTGANRYFPETVEVAFTDTGTGRSAAAVGVLTETVTVAQFTDGLAAAGTYQMVGALPAGALVLGTKVIVDAGFAGNTSAAMTIGDGSTADRYNTSTINVFTTAAGGVQSGVPSGSKLLTAANRPTLTVTTQADFTAAVTDGSGIVTVSIYYIQTA